MTESFYRSHSSSNLFGKKAKITTDIIIKQKKTFNQDELVTIVSKAILQTENGLRSGLEVESQFGTNDIVPYNFVEIVENKSNNYLSHSEYSQRQAEILNTFLAQNSVNDYDQLKALIAKYHLLVKNLENYIIVTPQTTIDEITLKTNIKSALIKMGYNGNTTLFDISKMELSKQKKNRLGVKSKLELEYYLNLAGLKFQTVEKIRKKKVSKYQILNS